ncbi:alpha/beta hydrolase [Vallitalea sediminicola]
MYIEMTDGVKLYVKREGKGKPCIFIHGGPGSWSYDYEVYGGRCLQDSIDFIYFDQRGCGRSEGENDTDYSINRIIRDIEEVRTNLGIESWIVIAHSFGGIIAINYVEKYKEHVDGLILLSCTLYMEDSFKSQIYHGRRLLSLGNDYELDDSYEVLDKWNKTITELLEKDIFYKLQYISYESYKRVNNLFSEVDDFNRSMGNQAFTNKGYNKCYYEITEIIDVPVLVIVGNKDYAIGCRHYENFLFPNAKYNIIDGKHLLYIENNNEYENAIREFLKEMKAGPVQGRKY